jgi:hypothetical protein
VGVGSRLPFDVMVVRHQALLDPPQASNQTKRNRSCKHELATEFSFIWAKVCPSAPLRFRERGRGEIGITSHNLRRVKAIHALPSASPLQMYLTEYMLTHIFVVELIEDVYLRMISRY